MRDLVRFLRNDNAMAVARRICGERNIIRYDLIPIMKSPTTSDKLFDITLRYFFAIFSVIKMLLLIKFSN